MLSGYNYEECLDTPQQLAKKIIDKLKEDNEIRFPIDPFKLLSMNGIIYQFRDFDKLEGIYIVPENELDIPIIGINNNRPITRQRYTAAHELCHHIKDRTSKACPINGKKNEIETFADRFASELLMPRGYFEVEAEKYLKNGYVDFDDILKISLNFGVSFESCVYTLAYRCNYIEGDIDPRNLRNRIRKFKPDNRRLEMGFDVTSSKLQDQIINSYTYFFEHDFDLIWHKFKNDYIFNESRIEGSKLDTDLVAEIVTDLRLHMQNSEYCVSEHQDVIETVGQSSLYDYIFSTPDEINVFSIMDLHRLLYKYAPYPEAAGSFRTSNNFVTQSKFETCDYNQIFNELLKLEDEVKNLIDEKDSFDISEYIEKAIYIHHRLTVIHPFHDGNGRISRIFLNWLFKSKGLPPIYLKYKSKQSYYEALQFADVNEDYRPLKTVFFNEIIRTMIQLYDGRRILDDDSYRN